MKNIKRRVIAGFVLLAVSVTLLGIGFWQIPSRAEEANPYEGLQYVDDQLLVGFKPLSDFSLSEQTKYMNEVKKFRSLVSDDDDEWQQRLADIVDERDSDNEIKGDNIGARVFAIKVDNLKRNPVSIIKKYEKNKYVDYAEPNYIGKTAFIPNDPLFSSQKAANDAMGITAGWDISRSSDIVMAVIDTGSINHEDHPTKVGAISYGYSKIPTEDTVGHGTMVQGTLGALGNNGKGVAGVNMNAKILNVKCDNSAGRFEWSALASSIRWAADNGARIINMSLGGTTSLTFENAVDYAFNKGVAIFEARGNDGVYNTTDTSTHKNIMAVAATGDGKTRSSWSSYGYPAATKNFVTAVGSAYTTNKSGAYSISSGTSFSSPLTAGIASLVLGIYPDATPQELYDIIKYTCTDMMDPGFDQETGWGLVNLQKALVLAQSLADGTVDKSILLSVSGTHTFPEAGLGYGTQTPVTVTVTNKGTVPTGALTIALSNTTAFQITNGTTVTSGITLPNGTGTFQVGPKTGLASGTYLSSVTVSGSGIVSQSFMVSFTVGKGVPNNTANSVTTTYAGSSFNLTASPLSGLFNVVSTGTRTYSIEPSGPGGSPTGAATISGNTLTVTKAGIIYVGLVTAENTSYYAGPKVIATLTVNKRAGASVNIPNQSIATNITSSGFTVSGITLSFSGQQIEYAAGVGSSSPDTPWQTSATFTTLAPSTQYYIFARSAADDLHTQGTQGVCKQNRRPTTLASVKQNQAALSITGLSANYTYGVSPITLGTSGGSTNGTVTYTSSNTTVASFSGNVLTINRAGSFNVTATMEGNSTYNPVTSSAVSVNVALAAPTVTLSVSASLVMNQPVTLTATVKGVGGANLTGNVVFSNGTTNWTVALSGGVATQTATIQSTSTTFTATYAGQANYYSSGSDSKTVTAAKLDQTALTINLASTYVYGVSPVALTVSGGSTSGAVTYTITSGTAVASISGSTLTITKAGTFTIQATKAGNDQYNAVTATQTVTVSLATPTVTLSISANPVLGGTATLTAKVSSTGSTPAGTVTFTNGTTNWGPVTLSGGSATQSVPISSTSTTFTVNYGGETERYTTGSASLTVDVTKQDQAPLAITNLLTAYTYGVSPITLGTSGGSTNGAVTYTITSGTGIASLAGNVLIINKAGTFTVSATMAGNAGYYDVTASVTVVISTASSSVNLIISDNPVLGASATLTATVSGSGGAVPNGTVTFSDGATTLGNVALTSGKATQVVTIDSLSKTFTASYNGEAERHDISTANISVSVNKLPQNPLSITDLLTSYTYGVSPVTLGISGGSSGGTVTYTITSGTGIASLAGNVLTINKAGTFTVSAVMAGNSTYNDVTAAPITVTVSQRNISLASVTVTGDTTFSGSQIKPEISVNDGGLITTADYTVTYGTNIVAGGGTIILTGQNNYTGTKTVTFTIEKAQITIEFITSAGTSVTRTYSPNQTLGQLVNLGTSDYGIFSWATLLPSSIYNAGTYTDDIVFTPTAGMTDNYIFTPVQVAATLIINKSNNPPAPFMDEDLKYSADLVLDNDWLPSGWEWANPELPVSAGNNTFTAVFVGDTNYNAGSTAEVTFAVAKGKRTETPQVIGIYIGEEILLADTFTYAENKTLTFLVLTAGWEWEFPNTPLVAGATQQYKAVYTGDPNYEDTKLVIFTVLKANPVQSVTELKWETGSEHVKLGDITPPDGWEWVSPEQEVTSGNLYELQYKGVNENYVSGSDTITSVKVTIISEIHDISDHGKILPWQVFVTAGGAVLILSLFMLVPALPRRKQLR